MLLIGGNPLDYNILKFEVLNSTPFRVSKLSAKESYFKLGQNGTSLAIGTLMTRRKLKSSPDFPQRTRSDKIKLDQTSTAVFMPVR